MVVLPLYRCDSRSGGTTLTDVGEQDWLEHGHGGGEGLQPMIKGSAGHAGERVSIRNVLRGTDSMTPRNGSRRRTKALVGWLLYCCTAAGGTAAAWTVRETLFPSLGAPTERSVWDNSSAETTATTEPASASSEAGDTTVIESTVVAATASTPESSIEGQTVPSASLPGGGPNNTFDNHGSDGGNVPETGTTVAGTPSGNGPGGPVTTVDDHTTNTSTPASVSNPPASLDPPQTSASTPDPATTDTSAGHQSGKGGGGSDDTTP